MMHLEMSAMTDVGRRRHHNEDAVLARPSHGFAILADGMGGYNAGEVASAMAVEIIAGKLEQCIHDMPRAQINEETGFTGESVLIREAIKLSNDTIYRQAQERPECSGMGTTVLVAAIYGNHLTAAHVGDSRMYRLRDDILAHVTEDHSLIHEQVRRGLLTAADARNSNIKNLVTRALGVEAGVEPDLVEDFVCEGDIYLMCSDGLTDVVSDETIQATIIAFDDDLPAAGNELVRLANEAGGPDNISVILIRAGAAEKKKQGLLSRMFKRK